MGIAERREREKEALRTRIVEAARDIVSERGLDGLSMRGIAERIEYSPATIYLYFRDKEDLLGEVIEAGFARMGEYIEEEMGRLAGERNPALEHRALGRAYARFGLENTAYFRVMFELPTVPQLECATQCDGGHPTGVPEGSWEYVVGTVRRAMDAGLFAAGDPLKATTIAWGLIHGLTSLYLSGHLSEVATSHEAFLELVEMAMDSLGSGFVPRETPGGSVA
jgi:AcrR family transcriptional regulator